MAYIMLTIVSVLLFESYDVHYVNYSVVIIV